MLQEDGAFLVTVCACAAQCLYQYTGLLLWKSSAVAAMLYVAVGMHAVCTLANRRQHTVFSQLLLRVN